MIAAGNVEGLGRAAGLAQGFGIGLGLAVELGALQAADGGEDRQRVRRQVADRAFGQNVLGGELHGGLEP